MWELMSKAVNRFRNLSEISVPSALVPTYRLLHGRFEPESEHQSLLFFTVHKAASTFASGLMDEVAAAHGIASLDLARYLHSTAPTRSERRLRRTVQHLFIGGASQSRVRDARVSRGLGSLFLPAGCLYCPLRDPRLLQFLPALDRFKIIVMLRDPRDCLTSLYFSVAYSHRPPGNPELLKRFEADRATTRQKEIDDFVMDRAPGWLNRYQLYCDALRDHASVHLLTYEQFVTDFPGWLDRIAHIWGLPIEGELRERLLKRADFSVDQEDVYSHKRQVQPGDHRRKLRPETIRSLTELLRPVLVPLGYDVENEDAKVA